MRSSIITLVLLLSIGVSWAGDRNRIIALGVRNFTYTPKEGKETVGSALGSIANVLITGRILHNNHNTRMLLGQLL